MTVQRVPDTTRTDTYGVTPSTARYSIEDRRWAITELDACPDEDIERATVLGHLMQEVRRNGRGGASPELTARSLALCDVYDERQRARLGYGRMPLRVADLAEVA